MSDIVERLREVAERPDANYPAVMEQAADTITRLRAENERLKTSGIVEVAAHNPSVMDYMRHWEGRAEKAEVENERLRAALMDIHAHIHLRKYSETREVIDAALEEKP